MRDHTIACKKVKTDFGNQDQLRKKQTIKKSSHIVEFLFLSLSLSLSLSLPENLSVVLFYF